MKIDVLYSEAGVATQILLSHESGDMLVDAGDGVMRDLRERRYDFCRLRAVLLTHEHVDHISGLYALLAFLKNVCRVRKQWSPEPIVVAPKPVHHVNLMIRPPLAYWDLGPPIELQEASSGEELLISGFKILPFAVDHLRADGLGDPIGGNLGYSITDREGFRVVISGDTRTCVSLERQVEGADVALLEASMRDEDWEKAIEFGHMTRSQAERIGSRAKRAIYIHQPRADLSTRTNGTGKEGNTTNKAVG